MCMTWLTTVHVIRVVLVTIDQQPIDMRRRSMNLSGIFVQNLFARVHGGMLMRILMCRRGDMLFV